MTTLWDPNLGLPPPDASCRGCAAVLWRYEGPHGVAWMDSTGYQVCVPVPDDAVLAALCAQRPMPVVFHQPMPAGLRGGEAPGRLDRS